LVSKNCIPYLNSTFPGQFPILPFRNAPINVKPQGGRGREKGQEIDTQGCPLGRDFEHAWCPSYSTFREKVTLEAKFLHSLIIRG